MSPEKPKTPSRILLVDLRKTDREPTAKRATPRGLGYRYLGLIFLASAYLPPLYAGSDVIVLPGKVGPYLPGEEFKVRIYLRQDPSFKARLIRRLRFDFSDSHPDLELSPCDDNCAPYCNVSFPLFVFRECLTGGEQADPARHSQIAPLGNLREFPSELIYDGPTPAAIYQILLPIVGCFDPAPGQTEIPCLPVAKFVVRVPKQSGNYLLDVLNADDLQPAAGGLLEFGFQPPDDPIDPFTRWTARDGDLHDGQFIVQVMCDTDADCDDDDACTVDSCVDSVCQNEDLAEVCDDGFFCTAFDVCVDGTCMGEPYPCAQFCDELDDLCVACLNDTDCDDLTPCTSDSCTDGVCIYEPIGQQCAGCSVLNEPCCETHSQPGCNNLVCCQAVCAASPACCDPFGEGWDLDCVVLAESLCNANPDCNNNCRNDGEDVMFGSSSDCDDNGVPDECDIEACSNMISCDDCNLNGRLDVCDDPLDAMPDACVSPSQGGLWSENIWNLNVPGFQPYPDDVNGVPGRRVTLKGSHNLLLDVDVSIPTLRMLAGATLRVNNEGQGDLTVTEPGGMLVEGPTPNGSGFLVSNNRTVTVSDGSTRITKGGRVVVASPAVAAGAAESTTMCQCGESRIEGGSPTFSSLLDLSGDAVVFVDGNFEINGSESTTCDPDAGTAGGEPCLPPIVRKGKRVRVGITGKLKVNGRAILTGGPAGLVAGPGGVDEFQTFSETILLGNDFEFRSDCPNQSTIGQESLTFVPPNEIRTSELFQRCAKTCGTEAIEGLLGTSRTVHKFAVAGSDLGPVLEGFELGDVTSGNFAVGNVTVGSGSEVQFRSDVSPGFKALYVKELVVESNGRIGCVKGNVYYLRAVGIKESIGSKFLCDFTQVPCTDNNQCLGVCGQGSEPCFTRHSGLGCQNASCCRTVCGTDPFCCAVAWDQTCVDQANLLCEPDCPLGDVTWVDPPDGIVYAGYSFDPTSFASLGPREFEVEGPRGASSSCFQLCETNSGEVGNSILSVLSGFRDGASDTYRITLEQPITPGVTFLSYRDNEFSQQVGRFTAHPGNVNADGLVDMFDVTALIDCCLQGTCTPAWGIYSCDIDQSGAGFPPDLIALIDLLNGAGPFNPAIGTFLPVDKGECQ